MAELKCSQCRGSKIIPVTCKYTRKSPEWYCHSCEIATPAEDVGAWARVWVGLCRLLEKERKR